MQKTAIILGATGLTGSYVLDQLITNENYTYIKLFSRKSTGNKHPKVEEFIVDLQQFESFEKDFTGDEVYCCIGTTKKKTPNKDVYRTIDDLEDITESGKTSKVGVVIGGGLLGLEVDAEHRRAGRGGDLLHGTNVHPAARSRPLRLGRDGGEGDSAERAGAPIELHGRVRGDRRLLVQGDAAGVQNRNGALFFITMAMSFNAI